VRLDDSVFQCEGGGERGGEGCGIAPGWRWPFIGAGERRGWPETAGGGGNWRIHGCHYRCGFVAWGGEEVGRHPWRSGAGGGRGGARLVRGGRRPGGPRGLMGREAEWSCWPRGPGGLMGRLAAWAGRPNVKEKNFRIKN
jgi:hypothetical protein